MIDRAGQVWDTGSEVGVILHTTPFPEVPGWSLHTYIKLYAATGGEGVIQRWSEDPFQPYERYAELVRIV